MNWLLLVSAVAFGCSLVWFGCWGDEIKWEAPPSAIRASRNKCVAWFLVAFAALLAGLWVRA